MITKRLVQRVLWFCDNRCQETTDLVINEFIWLKWREHNLDEFIRKNECSYRLIWKVVAVDVTAVDTRKCGITKCSISYGLRRVIHDLARGFIHDAETHLEVDTLTCVVDALWALNIVREILNDRNRLNSTKAKVTCEKLVVVCLSRWDHHREGQVCVVIQSTNTIRHVDNAKDVLVLLELDRKEVLRYRVVIITSTCSTNTTVWIGVHVEEILGALCVLRHVVVKDRVNRHRCRETRPVEPTRWTGDTDR